MSARPYRLGQRQASVELTRSRILAAARQMLAAKSGVNAFTIDTVAEQAGVARMTVYYQFGSKRGLLEALSDDLAAHGLVGPLRAAFSQTDPLESFDAIGRAFCGFWASDRIVIRRLRSLAALDQDIDQSVRARDERRREGLRTIVGRLASAHRFSGDIDEAVDVLNALTSFETFDALAQRGRRTHDVAEIVIGLMRITLGLPPRGARRRSAQKAR